MLPCTMYAPPGATGCHMKSRGQLLDIPLWLLVVNAPATPKAKQVTATAFGYPAGFMLSLYAEELTTHFGHRTWRTRAGTDQEASCLLAGFHYMGRCYAGCWEKVHQQCYPAVVLWSCSNGWPDMPVSAIVT